GSTDDEDSDEEIQGVNVEGDDEEETNEEVEANELYKDVNVHLVGRDTEMTVVPRTIIQTTQMFWLLLLMRQVFCLQQRFLLHPLLSSHICNKHQFPHQQLFQAPPYNIFLTLALFGFDHRLKALEDGFLEFKQTNQFAEAVSLILDIVDTFLANKMNEAVKTAVQLQSDKLRDEAQAENEDFINKLDENLNKIIKEQVKEQILSRLKDLKMIKMKMKNPPLDQTGGQREVGLEKEPESTSAPKEKTSKSSGKSKEGSKSHQEHTGKSTQAEEPIHKDNSRDSFNELMDTSLDFSAFVMNRLKVDTLTPELLAEVCKATTDKLDWNNPEGQQYPHDMRKPLPLIPNSRGRQVIPFEHFINNDLAYLSGGVSSRIYTTSVTKTKAVDYGHIKWIEGLVPNAMWSQVPVSYDKHALWNHCCHRLQNIKWHNYKHLDWITVRVKSYQKKLNLIKPDMYRSDLKRKETYTACSCPRGFIYHNKDKKNRLMRIDELHKFSDGTLNDVRTALDDHLKGIRMKYLPQTIWRQKVTSSQDGKVYKMAKRDYAWLMISRAVPISRRNSLSTMTTRNQEIDNALKSHDKAITYIQATLSALSKQQEAILKVVTEKTGSGSGEGGGSGSAFNTNGADSRNNRSLRIGKIDFPKFSGDDVEGWVYRCEHFFAMDETPEGMKLRYAVVHYEGDALQWHRAYLRTRNATVAEKSGKRNCSSSKNSHVASCSD
nr:hypothetical protein [Tanacetum cinerariifolium]